MNRPGGVFENLLRRLPLGVQLPVPDWAIVRGVQDRMLEEGVRHSFQFLRL